MKRFALADMVMGTVWLAATAYFVRIGLDLRRKGYDVRDIAIGVGLFALLNAVVCVVAIAVMRRLKARVATKSNATVESDQR